MPLQAVSMSCSSGGSTTHQWQARRSKRLGPHSQSLSKHDPRTCKTDILQLSRITTCFVPARQDRQLEGGVGSGTAIFRFGWQATMAVIWWQQAARKAPLCSRQERSWSHRAHGGIHREAPPCSRQFTMRLSLPYHLQCNMSDFAQDALLSTVTCTSISEHGHGSKDVYMQNGS